MAKWNKKGLTPEEKEKRKDLLRKQVENVINNFENSPENIVEYLKFNSKFHQYSANNTLLIYEQNSMAQFCASYKAFQDMGYQVQKGQTGMKIFVPYITTVFHDTESDQWIKLSEATKEQKDLVKSGQLESKQFTSFGIGTVFDIGQTDCPPEEYPKLCDMGFASETHQRLYDALVYYAESQNISVEEKFFPSITTRGYYDRGDNSIALSNKLNDSMKLSVMSHELAHAVMHSSEEAAQIPRLQMEIEADSLSLMLRQHLGITEIEDVRQDHLKSAYKNYIELAKSDAGDNEYPDLSKILDNVNKAYLSIIDDFNNTVTNYLEQHKDNLKDFSQSIDDLLNENLNPRYQIYVCKTTEVMKACGVKDLDVVINQSSIKKILSDDKEKFPHAHNLSVQELKELPIQLQKPIMAFKGSHENSIVFVTDIKDIKDNEILISVDIDTAGYNQNVNRVTSMYGKDNITNYLKAQIDKGNLIGCDKKRANQMLSTRGLQLPPATTFIDYTDIIPNVSENVNSEILPDKQIQDNNSKRIKSTEKVLQNEKNFSQTIDDFLDGKINPYAQIFVCKTTSAMIACGAQDLDIIINQSTLRKIMSNDKSKYRHPHNIDENTIKSIPKELDNPIMILQGSEPSSIVLISNLTDKNNQNIIISCKLNSEKSIYEVNEITSVYPKNNIANYINIQLNKHNLIGCNKKRANRLLKSLGLQSSEVEASIDYTDIIPNISKNVNSEILSDKQISASSAAIFTDKQTVVVNCFAGPGAGKTTCAWEIASKLKKLGIETEYVGEYAKELVWDGNRELLDGSLKFQKHLYDTQNHRVQRLLGKVDVVVTDSPAILSAMYLKQPNAEFESEIIKEFKLQHNFNLFINRGNTFQQIGRIHNLEESKVIDNNIKEFLERNEIYYGIYEHSTINKVVKNIQTYIETANNVSFSNNHPTDELVDEHSFNKSSISPNEKALKLQQYTIINEFNPAPNTYQTWIRNIDDVKSFDETLNNSDWEGWEQNGFDESYTPKIVQDALSSGKITIYSSHPIEQGVFVTPSPMEAQSYSGDRKIYSKEVDLKAVAWIDPTQGQYANVEEYAAQMISKPVIVAKYKGQDAINVIMQYPNGLYYNHYGYDFEKDISQSNAGGFKTVEEAKEMMLKHRSDSIEITEPEISQLQSKSGLNKDLKGEKTVESKDDTINELPKGWQWVDNDDLSGHLNSPDGKTYFSYDWTTGEYKITEDRRYDFFMKENYNNGGYSIGSLKDFKEYAENWIKKNVINRELEDILNRQLKDTGELPVDVLCDEGKIEWYSFAGAINNTEKVKELLQDIQQKNNQVVSIFNTGDNHQLVCMNNDLNIIPYHNMVYPYNDNVYPTTDEALKAVLENENIAKLVPYDTMLQASTEQSLLPLSECDNGKYPFVKINWSDNSELAQENCLPFEKAEELFSSINELCREEGKLERTGISLFLDVQNSYNLEINSGNEVGGITEHLKQLINEGDIKNKSLWHLQKYLRENGIVSVQEAQSEHAAQIDFFEIQ